MLLCSYDMVLCGAITSENWSCYRYTQQPAWPSSCRPVPYRSVDCSEKGHLGQNNASLNDFSYYTVLPHLRTVPHLLTKLVIPVLPCLNSPAQGEGGKQISVRRACLYRTVLQHRYSTGSKIAYQVTVAQARDSYLNHSAG